MTPLARDLVFQTPATFPAWGQTLAARIAPELGLRVASHDLRGKAWGVASRPVGIGLDLDAIADANAPFDRGGLLLNFGDTALGILLHEVAHGGAWPRPDEIPQERPTRAKAIIEAWATETQSPASVPWAGHGGDFIRAAGHVAYRAGRLLGFRLDPQKIIDGRDYALSPLAQYIDLLGDEPAAMDGKAFTEIRNIRPPERFIQLWQSDVRAWFLSQERPTNHQARETVSALDLFPL